MCSCAPKKRSVHYGIPRALLFKKILVLQGFCCTNTSFCATLNTTLLLHKNGWNMTCIILKQGVYYKIMAGITCFCCTNRKFFSIRQSLRSRTQYFLYLLSQYIVAVNTDSWRGGKLHKQKNYRMVFMLCSFSFVIHRK